VVRDVVSAAPREWCRHDELLVDGVPVGWWVDSSGAAHASGSPGLAAALAWAAGLWPSRFLLTELLAAPDRTAWLLANAAFD
jgi:hypothetical protein